MPTTTFYYFVKDTRRPGLPPGRQIYPYGFALFQLDFFVTVLHQFLLRRTPSGETQWR
jgi:hypothetical protein